MGQFHSNLMMVLVTLLALLMAGCRGSGIASSTGDFPEQTGFVQRQVFVDGAAKSVWVFVPPGYTRNRMYPAILFLHGLFEQGSGNGDTNVLSAGLGPVIARNPERWPFITIFPQSTGTWSGLEREHLAMAALDEAEKHYMIDPGRVILAGLSYGGLGVWEIGARNPDRFAALVPVSGPSDVDLARSLAATPVWAFASQGDIIVSSDNSDQMCRAISTQGGRALFTKFQGGQHDCWAQAVTQSDLLNWMLQQRRNPLQASVVRFRASGKLRSFDDP